MLPSTPPCYLNVTSRDFQSVHFPSYMSYYTQESFFLALRDKNPLNLENIISDAFRERS